MSKYLNQIADNDKVKLILSNIIQSKNIPHAFLFIGLDGIGKENAALCFTKELNIADFNIDSKNKILKAIESLSEPFVKYVCPLPRGKNETDQTDPYEKISNDEIELINLEFQKKAKNPFYRIEIPRANFIKISSIRDIHKYLSFNYDDVKYRVIIISQSHLMNSESQNALLKNLEEPPDGVVFVLCTDSPEKLRETIRSRCWNIHFQPLKNETLSKILIDKFGYESEIVQEVVPFSFGSINEAILLIENDFQELREKTIKILRYSFGRKFHSAYLEFEELLTESDPIKLKLIIRMIITWLNDFQKIRLSDDPDLFFVKHIETLEKFNSKFPNVELIPVIQGLDEISSYLRNNINLNVAVSNVVFRLSLLTA